MKASHSEAGLSRIEFVIILATAIMVVVAAIYGFRRFKAGGEEDERKRITYARLIENAAAQTNGTEIIKVQCLDPPQGEVECFFFHQGRGVKLKDRLISYTVIGGKLSIDVP